jgi:simple sugar transport system permease protein
VSTTTSSSKDERVTRVGILRRLLIRPELGALSGAALVWIFFALIAPVGFLSLRGTASYLEVSAQLGILAVAVALLMIGGEFDLSVGSVIGFSGCVIAILATEFGIPLYFSAGIALILALAIGFLNGYLVIKTGLPSFIITLGALFMVRGLTIGGTRLLTGRTQVGGLGNAPGYPILETLFASKIPIAGVNFPVSILWWFGVAAIATYVLLRTPVGNWIFGAGGDANAARNVGVPVDRLKIGLFMTTASAAWLVSVIQLANVRSADTLRGTLQEFNAIIAVVIGGTLLTGGYGSAIGAVLGALIFGMVRQGIVFAGIDADWFQVFLGAMLIAAVLVNNFIRKRAEASHA